MLLHSFVCRVWSSRAALGPATAGLVRGGAGGAGGAGGSPRLCLLSRSRALAGARASVRDGDPHRPGGAGDDLGRRLDVVGVQVVLLDLGDLADLGAGDGRRPCSCAASPEPLSMPAAFSSSREAGGVLVMNVNERSSYTVISTGTIWPRWASVAALYALQNSMMFTPCWPSAGPTGGAGVAGAGLDLQLDEASNLLLGGHVRVLAVVPAEVAGRGFSSSGSGRRPARPGSPGRRSRRRP